MSKQAMKNTLKVLGALLGAFGLVGLAQAATTTVVDTDGNAVEISHTASTTSGSGQQVSFVFNANGTLTIPKGYEATVRYLIVGGGGGGGGASVATGSGGGSAGQVLQDLSDSLVLAAAEYSASVGGGGAGGSYNWWSTSAGSSGNESSFSGSGITTITASGGAGGASGGRSDGTTYKITSDLTGSSAVYGTGGAARQESPSAATANTGNGGDGGAAGSSGAAGGSGIVVIQITALKRPPVYLTFNKSDLTERHISVSAVTADGAVVTPDAASRYALTPGKSVVATFAPESGYTFRGGDNPLALGVISQDTVVSAATYPNMPIAKQGSRLAHEVEYSSNDLTTIIGYEGATVTTNAGDLVFTFNDTAAGGRFEMMKPYLYEVKILAVGGGGGGGTQAKQANGAGGGGAGGYREVSDSSFSAGLYTVAVGAGARRHETKITALPGNNGGNSFVTNETGYVFVAAAGGGGGGASLGDGKTGGLAGGSGGGGAWISGVATKGGRGAGGTSQDGQGHDGGTPTYKYYGGGGGGAGSEGGALGEFGEGLFNDITGERIEYARGGAGGKDDTIAPAEDGTGPGWGGAGGNGGFGGAGGDGVVIIRVSAMHKNIQIQRPSVLNKGLKTDGPTEIGEDGTEPISEFVYDTNTAKKVEFVSPNYDAYVLDADSKMILNPDGSGDYLRYRDVTNYVDHVWKTNCWVETFATSNVVHGLGHHQFTMHLKPSFSWIDKTDPDYGSSEGALVDWRITTDLNIVDATIAVEKVVKWAEDGSNATITVSAYATPKQNPITPKVLFIGTVCGAHSLEYQTIIDSINAIAKRANVDWYLCGVDSNEQGNSVLTNSLTCGTSLTSEQESKIKGVFKSEKAHSAIHGFLERLYASIDDNHSNYDYVVLEFDGSRIAGDCECSSQIAEEEKVAKRMAWYYENDRVIWITDHCNADGTGSKATEVFKDDYYRPNTFYAYHQDEDSGSLGLVPYRALVAMLDPKNYFDASGKAKTSLEALCTEKKTSGSSTYYANARNGTQEYYDSVENVTNLLAKAIQPVAYNLTYTDQVKTQVGLDITAVEFFVTTNNIKVADAESEPWNGDWSGWWRIGNWDAETGAVDFDVGLNKWKDLTGKDFGTIDIDVTKVETSSNLVTLVMKDMLCETRGKIIIHVVDDGTFKTTEGATWNSVTQEWEKDPNKGKARVVMSADGQELTIEGTAATSAPLSFKTFWVVAGAENGDVFLNGTATNWMGFAEYYSPVVAYRGLPGYVIDELYVDANAVEIEGARSNCVMFTSLSTNHAVKVFYTNYVKSVTATPTTNVYDGAAHVFDVRPAFIDGVTFSYEIRYAMNPDDVYTNATAFCEIHREQLKTRGDHPFYYKVYALQPGYGDELEAAGWVEIAEELVGEGLCTSTILPKPLTVTADSKHCNTGEEAPAFTVTYAGLIAGETVESALDVSGLSFACPYKKGDAEFGQEGQYPITPSGVKNKDEQQAANYDIRHVVGYLSVGRSAFVVNDVPQGPTLDPDDPEIDTGVAYVEKIYDGAPTSIVVNVTFPTDPDAYTILYSTNREDWSEDVPLFKDVCVSNKVWYALESEGMCFPATNYQYVTILPRPVTILSGSATKVYDRTALECATVTVVSPLGFVAGEEPTRMQGISARTDVGSSANNICDLVFPAGVKASNYAITKQYGTLTVTQAPMIIGPNSEDPSDPRNVVYPVDPDKGLRPGPGENGVENVTNVYDGAGVRIKVNVVMPETGYTIKYSGDGENWVEDFAYTNVVDSGKGIHFVVEDDKGNYTPVTNIAFVTILPREAGLTADSASKVYDGAALTAAGYTATGFIEGEGVKALKMTGTSILTDVGTCANVIDEETVEPLEGTDFANYTLGYTNGVLEVTKRTLVLTPKDQSAKWTEGFPTPYQYDVGTEGANVAAEGYVEGEQLTYTSPTALTAPGRAKVAITCADNGKAKVGNYEITVGEAWLTLSDGGIEIGGSPTPNTPPEDGTNGVKAVVQAYDGTGHALDVTVTYPANDATTKISYSTNAVDWSTANPAFTNVTEGAVKVWYAVEIANFTAVTNYSWVTVTQRVVTVTAADQTMTYGGKKPSPLTSAVENKVETDAFTVPLALTNEVYAAGTYPQEVVTNGAITAVNAAGEDVTRNYAITFAAGTLTVDQAEPTVTVKNVEKVYDGEATNIVVTVSESDLEIRYSLDGGETWVETLDLVDVKLVRGEPGAYEILCRVHDPNGNYADKTATATVTILPRPVTVKVKPITASMSEIEAGTYKERYDATTTYDNEQGATLTEEDRAFVMGNIKIDWTGDKKPGVYPLYASGETYMGNFVVEYIESTLTIHDKNVILYTVDGLTNCYNAAGWRVKVNVTDPSGAGASSVKYAYAQDAADWYAADDALCPAVTNVTADGGVLIWFSINAGVDYQAETNCATIMVTQKVVTVTAQNTGKRTGAIDPTLTATVTGMVPSEEPRQAELITYTLSREKGEAEGEYAIHAQGEASQGNYSVRYVDGTFTITAGAEPMPLIEPVEGVTSVYDGAGHIFVPKFDETKTHPTNPTITYSLNAAGPWAEDFALTNVVSGGAAQKVYFKIEAEGFIPTNGWSTVTITQRVASVTAKSASKVYDGTALTEKGWTQAGFVSIAGREEGVASAETAGTITDVGTVSNAFASITYNDKTLLSNYSVVTNQGELTVTAIDGATVTLQGNTNTVTWTGAEQAIDGWTLTASSTSLLTASMIALKEGHAARAVGTNAAEVAYAMGLKASGEDFTCTSKNFTNVKISVADGWLKIDPLKLSQENVAQIGPADVCYSGDAQEPEDVALSNKVLKVMLVEETDYVIERYANNTNVTGEAVVVLKGIGNYADEFNALFAITQKVLTVTADNKSVKYGEAAPDYTATITGFVKDEKSRESEIVSGEPTFSCAYAVGSAAGSYPITVDASGLKAKNYSFTTAEGTLTVGSASISHTPVPVSTTYDGKGHQIGLTVTDPDPETVTVTTNFALSEAGPFRPENYVFTNAVSTSVWYTIAIPNYTTITGSVTVLIEKRPVTLTSPTWEKPYTGETYTFAAENISIGGSEMAGNETFAYSNFATITDVGSTTATFDYASGTANTNNYEISVTYGTLTVTSPDTLSLRPCSGKWTYDGTAHATNDFTVVNPAVLQKDDDVYEVTYEGSITTPGKAKNVITGFVIRHGGATGKDVTQNYTVACETGVLEVVNATFTPTATPYSGVYDGLKHGISVSATCAGGGTPAITYALEKKGPFTETDPAKVGYAAVTNALVWYQVAADYHDTYLGSASVEITPLAVTFTSADASTKVPPLKTDLEAAQASMTPATLPEGESLVCQNAAEITEVGSTPARFEVVAGNAQTDLANYSIITNFGTLTVLDKDKITFKALDRKFAFDGTAKTCHEVDESYKKDLYDPADIVTFTFDEKSAIRLPKESPVSNVITSAKITRGGVDVTAEYSMLYLPGELTMTNIPMVGVSAVSTNLVYDGTNYAIKVIVPDGLKSTASVTYSRNGVEGTYSGTNPTFRNVSANTVYYKVEAEGYDTVSGTAMVTITRRPVTLVSEGGVHVYDGIAFSNATAAVSTETPLAEGDTFTANDFRVVTDATAESGEQNTFAFEIANPQTKETDLVKNYFVSYDYGKLVVSQAVATITFTVLDKFYDGETNATLAATNVVGAVAGETLALDVAGMTFAFRTPEVGDDKPVDAFGYAPDKVLFAGGRPEGKGKANYKITFEPLTTASIVRSLPPPLDPEDPKFPEDVGPYYEDPGKEPPAPVDAKGEVLKLSNYDLVTVYDAVGHTFDYSSLTNAIETNAWLSVGYKVRYSFDGKTWNANLADFTFTNVVATSFWYNVEAPFGAANYSNYIHAVGVTITQRVVQVTSGSESWTYDGQAHSNMEVSVSAGSFAPGEGIATNGFATITAAGEKDNAFTVAWTAADPANYCFSVVTGKIAVTQKRPEDGGLALKAVTDGFYYDGTGKEPRPGVTDEIGGIETALTEGVDFEYAWLDNTNATATAKVIAAFKGNYAGAVTNDFTILPREVTLASASDSWTYDGKPHTNTAVTASAYAAPKSGFVAGEGVTTGGFAVVTAVTKGTPNTFAWEFLAGTLATNYAVSVSEGTLTVTEAAPVIPEIGPGPGGPRYDPPSDPPPAPVPGAPLSTNDWIGVYDGEPHTILTNRIWGAIAENPLYAGNDPQVDYSLDGGTWTNAPFAFVDVAQTPTSFWYRISAANCSNYYHAAGVTITNRPTTIVFTAADKTYDGETTAICSATNFLNLVSGEAFDLDTANIAFDFANAATGTWTVAATGYSDEAVIEGPNTLKSNYSFTFVPTATASITAASIKPCPPGEEPPAPEEGIAWIGATNVVMEYTGNSGTNIVVCWQNVIPGNPDPVSLVYSTNLTAWAENIEFTNVFYDVDGNVTSQKVWFVAEFANYAPVTNAAFVTITPRAMAGVEDPDNPPADLPWAGAKDVVTVYKYQQGTNIIARCGNLTTTPVVRYSASETGEYVAWENLQFTNCCTRVPVWYKVEAENYQTFVSNAYVTITPAHFTAYSEDAEKTYDGIATNILPVVLQGVPVGCPITVEYAVDPTVPKSDYSFEVAPLAPTAPRLTGASLLSGAAAPEWHASMPKFVNVCTNSEDLYYHVYYRVSIPYFETAYGTNTVKITRRPVTIVFPPAVKYYDGNTNLVGGIETNLVGSVDNMVASERFDAYGSGVFKDKRAKANLQYFSLTGLVVVASQEAKFRNYIISYGARGQDKIASIEGGGTVSVPSEELEGTDLPGAILAAPSKPDDEKGKYPDPEPKPDPKGGDPVAPPEPTVPLSDYDTTNTYDAVGHTMDTNALWNAIWDPTKYVIDEAEKDQVRVTYSLDGAVWSETPPLFTNVTATSFWYCVEVPNYQTVVHAVAVTVLKRAITVQANLQSMVFDDPDSLTPGFGVPEAWSDATAGQADQGLALGDAIGFVKLWFRDEDWRERYQGGTSNENVIVLTNWTDKAATTVKVGDDRVIISNATANVSANYDITFKAGDLLVEENLPLFAATLKWMYVSDSFVAQLTIVNTNKTTRFRYKKGSMRFCFEDRTGTPYGDMKLWDWTKSHAQEPVETAGRAFYLADPDAADEVGGWRPGKPVVFGPTNATVSIGEAFRYLGKSPFVWVKNRQAPLHDYYATLVWTSLTRDGQDGPEMSIRIVAEEEMPRAGSVTTQTLLDSVASPVPTAPTTRAVLNEAAAFGLRCDPASETTCALTAFAVSEDRISGRIETQNAVSEGVPTANALVTLLGAKDLASGFTELGTIETQDGAFDIEKPEGMQFFKVILGVKTETFK